MKIVNLIVFLALIAVGCSDNSRQISELKAQNEDLAKKLAKTEEKSFKPGFGEIMSLTQMRHARLFFAGENQNWELADYELTELVEGFQDVEEFHPTHKTLPKPTVEMISTYLNEPLEEIRASIKDRNKASFAKSFQSLTNGCNGCHIAAKFDFNVVKQPTVPPFSNQDFLPKTK